jgi:hypothetical protein
MRGGKDGEVENVLGPQGDGIPSVGGRACGIAERSELYAYLE